MNGLILAMLLPMHFTAPTDTLGTDATGQVFLSREPVHAYIFHRLDEQGVLSATPGYADSTGRVILKPHAPGTQETVWLAPGPNGSAVTIFVLSIDTRGNLSAPSNGCVMGHRSAPALLATRNANWTGLNVPVVKQAPERCGPAALAMVMRYYGAHPAALREANRAYDPVLRGSLITELAAAARRAGYDADVATLQADSLIDLLNSGVPPILLYQTGSGPVTVAHFGVVTAWDSMHAAFTVHDGGARPRVIGRDDLLKRWETAGSQALIVRERLP